MIIEGLLVTTTAEGAPHISPMGPSFGADEKRFILRPFPTSTTYRNLLRSGEGVFHITDDVLILAKTALGALDRFPPVRTAEAVSGFILRDACRWLEFRTLSVDDSGPRVIIECETVHTGRSRDFSGFNRAKHAVLEAAVLASRIQYIPREEIEAEFWKFRKIVDKTGGERENEAMTFLEGRLAAYYPEPVVESELVQHVAESSEVIGPQTTFAQTEEQPEPQEQAEHAEPVEHAEVTEYAEPIEHAEVTEYAEPVEHTEASEQLEIAEAVEVVEPVEHLEFFDDAAHGEPAENAEHGSHAEHGEVYGIAHLAESDEHQVPPEVEI